MTIIKTTQKGIEYLVGLLKEKAETITRAIFWKIPHENSQQEDITTFKSNLNYQDEYNDYFNNKIISQEEDNQFFKDTINSQLEENEFLKIQLNLYK